MRSDRTDVSRHTFEIDSTREVEGLKLIGISIGTFAGTEERVFVIKPGHAYAFNTGDQGGGQN
jgi:hypothetical protein